MKIKNILSVVLFAVCLILATKPITASAQTPPPCAAEYPLVSTQEGYVSIQGEEATEQTYSVALSTIGQEHKILVAVDDFPLTLKITAPVRPVIEMDVVCDGDYSRLPAEYAEYVAMLPLVYKGNHIEYKGNDVENNDIWEFSLDKGLASFGFPWYVTISVPDPCENVINVPETGDVVNILCPMGETRNIALPIDRLPLTLKMEADRKPVVTLGITCDGDHDMLSEEIKERFPLTLLEGLITKNAYDNSWMVTISAEDAEVVTDLSTIYAYVTIPVKTDNQCANRINVSDGYSRVLPKGEYTLTATTYYLPLYLTVYPEDPSKKAGVKLDLTCDNEITDSNLQELITTFNTAGASMGMSMPLDMNTEQFETEIKDAEGNTYGYRYECPAIIRTVLMMKNIYDTIPAYVKLTCNSKSRIVVETGLRTDRDCRDKVSVIDFGTRMPVNPSLENSIPTVYMLPVGNHMNSTYTIRWEGEGEATLFVADHCTPATGLAITSFGLHNGIQTITPDISREWVQNYGSELYVECTSTEAGYVVFEKQTTESTEAADYQIVAADIDGVKALIDEENEQITVTLNQTSTTSNDDAITNGHYVVNPNDGATVTGFASSKTVAINKNGMNKKTYSITASRATTEGLTDATLKEVVVNNTDHIALNPYAASQVIYVAAAPTSVDFIPTVGTASASHSTTTSASDDLVAYSVTVTAPAGNQYVYTIHFRDKNLKNASLERICLNKGTKQTVLAGFNATKHEYGVANLDSIPFVSAEASTGSVIKTITQATRLPGFAQIIVTAPAGNEESYTIFFYPAPKEYTLEAYGKVNVAAVPAVASKVYGIQKNENEPVYPTSVDWTDKTSTYSFKVQGVEKSSQVEPVEAKTTFKLWVDEPATGYYFAGWNQNIESFDNLINTTELERIEYIRSTTPGNPTVLPTFYAHFRHPHPVGENIELVYEVTPDNKTTTGKIVFNVAETNAEDELILVVPEETGEFTIGEKQVVGDAYIVNFSYDGTSQTEEDHSLTLTLKAYDTTVPAITGTITVKYLSSSVTSFDINASADFTTATLSWAAQSGVENYEVRRDGAVVKKDLTTSSYTDEDLLVGMDYQYVVVGYNTSNEVITRGTVTVSTGILTYDNDRPIIFPHYAYFTRGNKTEGTKELTHIQKNITDFKHLFLNATTPAMDMLFVLVDNADEDKAICYVFVQDGEKYRVVRTFNPRKQSLHYGMENGVGELAGKKICFIGSCENAFTGKDNETEGFVYIEGNSEEQVDIYLDDCTITAKKKDAVTEICNPFQIFKGGVTEWFRGGASVFAFSSPGVKDAKQNLAFAAKFHIRGQNELKGNYGCQFFLLGNHPLASAPIAIRPSNEYDKAVYSFTPKQQTMSLHFDDNWVDGTKTNGWLGLRAMDNTPSIDLGNQHGMATFNGGQYRLWGSYQNTGNYTTTLAVSYRHFDMGIISVYGFGTDLSDGLGVHINDGTFTSYNEAEGSSAHTGYEKRIYRNALDIRLPAQSTINGGTFNEDAAVYLITDVAKQGAMPHNANGATLCRFPVDASDCNASPNEYITTLPTSILGNYNPYDPNENPSGRYGASSLNVGSDGKIYLYVVLTGETGEDIDCELDIYKYWHAVLPEMSASDVPGLGATTIGGNVKVQQDAGQTKQKYAYLSYFELDKWAKNNARMSYGKTHWELTYNGDAEVTNTEEYQIEHAMYMILPIASNEWFQFIPPFDVNNIYVVDFPTLGTAVADNETFLNNQGKANFDMIYNAYMQMKESSSSDLKHMIETMGDTKPRLTQLIPYDGTNIKDAHFYLYEAKNNGKWELSYTPRDYNQWKYVTPTQPTPENKRNKTKPYPSRGHYKRLDAVTSTPVDATVLLVSPWSPDDGEFTYHVYSMYFPAPLSTKYWDGKYIIFEGYGPQGIFGKAEFETVNGQETIFELVDDPSSDLYVDNNHVQLMGNYTLAKYTTTRPTFITFKSEDNNNDKYMPVEAGKTILPGRSFMVVNNSIHNHLDQVSLQGVATRVNNDPTDVPTISDNASLTAYGYDGKIVMESAENQKVCIYSATGSLIYSANLNAGQIISIPVPTGLYIISNGITANKVTIE